MRIASKGAFFETRAVGFRERQSAMGNFTAFAEITGAILAALALALGFEWLGLHGLMRLMPARRTPPGNGRE